MIVVTSVVSLKFIDRFQVCFHVSELERTISGLLSRGHPRQRATKICLRRRPITPIRERQYRSETCPGCRRLDRVNELFPRLDLNVELVEILCLRALGLVKGSGVTHDTGLDRHVVGLVLRVVIEA